MPSSQSYSLDKTSDNNMENKSLPMRILRSPRFGICVLTMLIVIAAVTTIILVIQNKILQAELLNGTDCNPTPGYSTATTLLSTTSDSTESTTVLFSTNPTDQTESSEITTETPSETTATTLQTSSTEYLSTQNTMETTSTETSSTVTEIPSTTTTVASTTEEETTTNSPFISSAVTEATSGSTETTLEMNGTDAIQSTNGSSFTKRISSTASNFLLPTTTEKINNVMPFPFFGMAEVTKCPNGSVEILGRCYMFMLSQEGITWIQARAKCQEIGGDLAIIKDCYLLQIVIGFIFSNGLEAKDGYWIGGTDELREGDWLWIDASEMAMGLPFWGTVVDESFLWEPAQGSVQNCVHLDPTDSYYFHDGDCTEDKNPLCVAPMNGSNSCPSNYTRVMDKCFSISDEVTTWKEGRKVCAEVDGGDLAILNDCRLYGATVQKIEELGKSKNSLWIGGTDRAIEGAWVWTDGSPLLLATPAWGKSKRGPLGPKGGTSKNCAVILKKDRYHFHDEDCDSTAGFAPLCQVPMKSSR